jgi:hypothetical protein
MKTLTIFLTTVLLGIVYFAVRLSGWNDLPPAASAGLNAAMRGGSAGVSAASKQQIVTSYGKLPLSFEANRGQTDSRVKFISRSQGNSLFLTDTEMVLALSRHFSPLARRAEWASGLKRSETTEERSATDPVVLRMKPLGANQEPRVEGLEELPGKSNYFIGNDPAKWRTKVTNYAKVKFQAIYPGVDLVYYGNQGQLEDDFIVAPGADPKAILLGFQGTEKLRIDAQGDLVLRIRGGEVRLRKPIVYQSTPASGSQAADSPGGKQFVTARYVLRGNCVGFVVGEYDARKPLTIDPLLSYSTYLGGSGSDSAAGIVVDAAGNAYVTGQTFSINFPTQNPFQGTTGDRTGDAFVAKLDNSGSTLLYSTYLAGSKSDGGAGIAVDAAGNAYVTGVTSSSDFPTVKPVQPSLSGSSDAFIAKIDTTASGTASLVYSTYLGGSDAEGGAGVAVDSSGNAYVTGYTQSSNFPTANPLQGSSGGGTCFFYYSNPFSQPCPDAFIAKLNPSGSALVFSTYLGGKDDDRGTGIAVDSSGNSYVTGHTQSSNFPTSSPIQPNLGGFGDAFVAKLNATGSALTYSTYLGGNSDDQGNGIAVDSSGNAYVTGSTSSMDFPTVFPVEVLNSGSHIFITKLNSAGSALVYSSYLGGSGFETGAGVAVDANGNAYVTGNTSSSNFPTVNPLQTSLRGFTDAFVSKIAPIPGPAVATSPVSLSFTPTPASPQPINTTSPPQQVTLTNQGDGSLTITGITIVGTNSSDFAQTNTCGALPAALASGSSCTFSVTFTPTGTGTRKGTLTISDNAVGNPHTVSLTGNFMPPDFSITASPNTATVSAGGSATFTLTISAINGFTGSVFFLCGGTPTFSTCSFSPNSVVPSAGSASSTLTITTTASSALLTPSPSRQLPIKPLYALSLALLGMVLVGVGFWGRTSKKLRIGSFSVGLLFILVAVQAGCGSPKPGTPGAGTPPGTYDVVVTGRVSSLQHSATVTLTVR